MTPSAECADVEFETRSLPNLLVATLTTLPSMSLIPSGSLLSRLKLARLPVLARSYPRHFTLITRTAPCLRQLPSCVAAYPRDARSRRVLCRWSHQLHCKQTTLQTSS